MLAPVALFVFNRPDHTKATLDALVYNTLASETQLFVFSDGAKSKLERDAVEAVRKLVRELNGFSSVTLIERDHNMGLARSIIAGVTELFDQFDKVIVLEDDLVTAKNFLVYMNDALDHYRHDQHAFSVTGHTFPAKFLRIPRGYEYDTYAGYRCSSWSWGTWRDRWQRIDWEMRYFPTFCNDQELQQKFNRGGQDLTESLRMQYEGAIDSWAIRFCYAHYANEMRCIYPTKTLVKNIGLDYSGTHSTPNPRFQHPSLEEAWLPRRFCPANKFNPKINSEFHAIFDPPRHSSLQLAFHKVIRFSRSAFLKALRAQSTIRRLLFRPTLDTDILFINTYQKSGGAARAAYRMFRGICEIFPGARYLTLFREDSDPRFFGLGMTSVRGAIALRYRDRDQQPLCSYTGKRNTFFSPALHPNPLRIRVARFKPKLAHLHWVGHGMLRVEEIGKLNCPIVWTLHDAWAFTGGCHYTEECESYKRQCGNCPQLGSMQTEDLSHDLMLRKILVFANLNLTIVSPSRWLASMAAQSRLFSGRRIEVIPNGLDTEAFKPIDRNVARDYFGISKSRPAILFGTHWLSEPRKGGDLLCNALRNLGVECTLITFGEGKLQLEDAPLVTVCSLGSLFDDASLALAYSAADVFLCPSREDNLPNTVAEALACGIPCVAFDTSGLPDMIEHQKTGWLAKPFDSLELAKGIRWVLAHADPAELSRAARAKAVSEYSMNIVTQRYSKLYAELLDSGSR